MLFLESFFVVNVGFCEGGDLLLKGGKFGFGFVGDCGDGLFVRGFLWQVGFCR